MSYKMLFKFIIVLLVVSNGLVHASEVNDNLDSDNAMPNKKKTLKAATDDDDDSVSDRPKDCAVIYKNERAQGRRAKSDVYVIWLSTDTPIKVYCDMVTDGGGWTVIQRRDDYATQENFYRNWADYKNGFGKLRKDFWLGNDFISKLTNQDTYYLRFDLADFDGKETYALYSNFRVADESEKYRMTVDSFVGGDAGDSLIKYHNGMKFSTKDQMNDIAKGRDCANKYKGGWWYGDCHESNPNGLYLSGTHASYADGINWVTFRGYYYSLKKTEIKIRPYWFKH